MKKIIKTLSLCLLGGNILVAQNTIQLHSGASLKMHSSSAMGVYGDLNNQASLDFSGAGDIFFFGETWANTATSSLGTGTSGTAFFIQPNALYSTTVPQNLDGGGTGVIFPNIQVANASHLQLINSASKIRVRLIFDQGCFILNDQNLVVGDGNIGAILQYNPDRFVVTNAPPNATSGFLIRERVDGVATDFPVGIAVGDYTPARLTNGGVPDDFSVRVFPDVFTNATSGGNKNNESVARTWHIEETVPGGADVELDLQHNIATEGVDFNPNNNYVARYIGTSPNSAVAFTQSSWDYVGSGACATNITPADITTGGAIGTAARNIRTGFDNFTDNTYYTAAICEPNALPIELAALFTQEYEDCTFDLIWETAAEENVAHFEIEVSTDAINFEQVAVEMAQNKATTYRFKMDKIVDKAYYLRIKTVDQDGSIDYSPIVAHTSSKSCQSLNEGSYSIYPNPIVNSSELTIRVHDLVEFPLKGQFVFTDVLGRTVLTLPKQIVPNNQTYMLNISSLSVGSYFVRYLVEGKTHFSVEKLIVTN